MSYTKGPWKVNAQDRRGMYHVGRDIGTGTNKTLISTDEALATERLIKAAPDMLEALNQAKVRLEIAGLNDTTLDVIKAAINKATGGAK